MGKRRNYKGQSFWDRGYYAETAGRDEEAIRDFSRKQGAYDNRIEQLGLLSSSQPPLGGSWF